MTERRPRAGWARLAPLGLFAAAACSSGRPPASAGASGPGDPPGAPGTHGETPAEASEEGALHRVESNAGEYTIEYRVEPDPLPFNAPFGLEVWVRDRAGELVRDARLEVDALMPAHRHGMNRSPRVEQRPDGSFSARGLLLHMEGHWVLLFDVSRDGVTDRAQVDLRVN